MQLKTRTWFLISLFCFAIAAWFWHLGDEWAQRHPPANSTNPSPNAAPIKELGANNFHHAPPLLTTLAEPAPPATANIPLPG